MENIKSRNKLAYFNILFWFGLNVFLLCKKKSNHTMLTKIVKMSMHESQKNKNI